MERYVTWYLNGKNIESENTEKRKLHFKPCKDRQTQVIKRIQTQIDMKTGRQHERHNSQQIYNTIDNNTKRKKYAESF